MVIKRVRAPLLLLTAVLIFSILAIPVAATGTLPAGFTGMDSVDLEVDSGYAWHTMTDPEAAAFGLTAYVGSNVYIAGNSGKDEDGTAETAVSNIAITVTEPGALTFEYALSTYSDRIYFFGYDINSALPKEADCTDYDNIAQGEVLPEDGSWASYTINVDSSAFVDGQATIYIAYCQFEYYGGEDETDLNFAAIRNVVYTTGGRSDVVKGYDSAMGSVMAKLVTTTTYETADLADLAIGSTYRLTATANTGYQFYGWLKHYTYNGEAATSYQTLKDGALEMVVDETSWYEPVFAAEGTYYLRRGANFYTTDTPLDTLMSQAVAGYTFVLLDDYTVTEDFTIPANVTLYVPFRAEWESEENEKLYHLCDESNQQCGTAIAGEDKTHVRLTVGSENTVTVNGTLVIGSVNGYPSQRYQGHVSGVHGRITNNGTIEIGSGGTLTCYGIVDGTGLVYAHDGSVVKEALIIGDFAGGSNSADLYFAGQMPFKRFALQSVQCKLQMEADSMLKAMANVWALSCYNELDVTLFGDDDLAAFRTNGSIADTVVLIRTYDASKSLTDGNGLLDVTGVGHMEWTFSGGLTFQPFAISLGGFSLSTESSDFTIPYNFKINLQSGTYTIPNGMRIMPGAEVAIESSATAKIGGRLIVMDGLYQTDMSGDRYPTYAELTDKGFSGSGELTVNGTLIMQSGSALGGLIKTTGGGTLVVEDGVYVSNSGDLSKLDHAVNLAAQSSELYTADGGVPVTDTQGNVIAINNWVQQDGAKGSYDENTVWFNLPARIYTAEGLVNVQAGTTYKSTAATAATVSYTFEYLYVANGVYDSNGYHTTSGAREMTAGSMKLSRTVSGAWENSTSAVPVAAPTVAGSGNSGSLTANVTVSYVAARSGNDTVLSGLVAEDAATGKAKEEKYVFLVKYTTDGDTVGTTVSPVDGVYTIPGGATGITIEAAMLGDVNGNGSLDARDVANLRKAILKTLEAGELATLAADINGNGSLDARDVANLRKAILGTYTI